MEKTMSLGCAPSKSKEKHTCFPLETLIELCKAYNKYIEKHKSDGRKLGKIEIKDDKQYLIKELMKRFTDVCNQNDHKCLTKQEFMKELTIDMFKDIKTNTFRPKGPTNPVGWLSSRQIDKIMQQYENIHNNFKFLGAVPIDCDMLSFCSTHKINYNNMLKNGTNIIGIIFNLDKHDQPGSHWVAVYMNLDSGNCYYYDPTGKRPPDDLQLFFKSFEKFCNSNNVQYKLTINKSKHQNDSSECGVYSCNFIIRLLQGETYDQVISNGLEFKKIQFCRDFYFYNKHNLYLSHAHDRC
jgi:hypothetical protein